MASEHQMKVYTMINELFQVERIAFAEQMFIHLLSQLPDMVHLHGVDNIVVKRVFDVARKFDFTPEILSAWGMLIEIDMVGLAATEGMPDTSQVESIYFTYLL